MGVGLGAKGIDVNPMTDCWGAKDILLTKDSMEKKGPPRAQGQHLLVHDQEQPKKNNAKNSTDWNGKEPEASHKRTCNCEQKTEALLSDLNQKRMGRCKAFKEDDVAVQLPRQSRSWVHAADRLGSSPGAVILQGLGLSHSPMFAFGHLVFLTAALWQCVRTEHDCEPVQATSSALLQSAPRFLVSELKESIESTRPGPGAKSVTWQISFSEALGFVTAAV